MRVMCTLVALAAAPLGAWPLSHIAWIRRRWNDANPKNVF